MEYRPEVWKMILEHHVQVCHSTWRNSSNSQVDVRHEVRGNLVKPLARVMRAAAALPTVCPIWRPISGMLAKGRCCPDESHSFAHLVLQSIYSLWSRMLHERKSFGI